MNARPAALAVVFFLGCSNGPHKPVAGESGANATNVSYTDVKPIFAKYCAACHPSQHRPDWLDYQQAKEYAQNGLLRWRVWEVKTMPQPGSPQAAAITDAERSTLAQWAQAGAPETANEPASGEKQPQPPKSRVPEAAQQCVQCHGLTRGEAESRPTMPILAGQNADYIAGQLKAFKWRTRRDPSNTMNDIALGLSDKAMRAAAEFFAGLTPFPAKTSQSPELRGRTLALNACGHCHSDPDNQGRPSDPHLPALVGQQPLYLVHQLLAFRDGERKSPLMYEFTKDLSNEDIEALAEYFAFAAPATQ